MYHPKEQDLKETFGLPFKTISEAQRTGQHIENQWPGRDGFFVPVAINDLPVYRAASFQAPVIKNMHLSERVRIIYKLPKPTRHEGETGYWVFVLSEDGVYTLGWIFDTYLAYTNRFEPVREWYIPEFAYRKGEYFAIFNAKENGRYLCHWSAAGSGLKLQGKETGQLYRYLNVIWTKKDELDSWFDFFSMDKNENLQMEWKYSKCQFKILKKL